MTDPLAPSTARDSQPTLRDWRGRRPALGWAGLRRRVVGLHIDNTAPGGADPRQPGRGQPDAVQTPGEAAQRHETPDGVGTSIGHGAALQVDTLHLDWP